MFEALNHCATATIIDNTKQPIEKSGDRYIENNYVKQNAKKLVNRDTYEKRLTEI